MPALVDLDIGMGRTGAATPEDAVAIAARLDRSARFAYAGLQAYSGRVQHIIAYHERAVTYGRQLDQLEETLTSLAENGLPPATVSGGGTGTFAIDV
ncbi:alanine racemase [Streptomyces sp. NPDC093149]|uniref:alanine racemase n=1 Tax=Streptomyces sp. NPDC093149 TaxID=3366031 RepID=UPI003829722B